MKQGMRGNYLHLFLSPKKLKIDKVLEQLHTPAPSSPNSSCTALYWQALKTAEIYVERNIYDSGISEKSAVNKGKIIGKKKKK